MAICKNCGNQVPDDAAFCANCGTPIDHAGQPQQDYQQAPQQPVPPVQPEVMNADGTVPGQDRGLAWLAYVPWAPVFLVPLFVRKTSEYCQYHVKQGATLWAVGVAYQIVVSIFLAIIDAIFPGARWYGAVVGHSALYNVFSVLFWAGSIFLFVLAIIGIVNAATGKKNELPLISKIPWIAMLIDKIYAAINK